MYSHSSLTFYFLQISNSQDFWNCMWRTDSY